MEEMNTIFGGTNHVDSAEMSNLSKGAAEEIKLATATMLVGETPKLAA
jgi:hypothetical protein